MYNESAIQPLIDRMGWYEPILPSAITLTSENSKSDSGRFFNSFHQLALVENVNACIPNIDGITNDTLNGFLYKMKRDSVLEVLAKVFDNNPLAYSPSQQLNGKQVTSINYSSDYNGLITSRLSVFDDAIGYSMAVRCLQLFLTTKRSNLEKVSISLSYEQMKLELEGFFNEYGKMIAQGSFQKFNYAIENAIQILFPTRSIGTATLRGVSVW